MSCSGRGECITQCCCSCYDDEDCDILSEICTCGHRNHVQMTGGITECDIYCRVSCEYNCQLVECHNFKLCGQKRPLHILDCHNGMCADCAVMIGKIKFIDKKDDCPICMENKDMIEISCGKHNICVDCWKTMSEVENRSFPLSCPLCRESIWKWKNR